MLLVSILILVQEEEIPNLKKTEKMLKPQNKVAFATTQRRSGITAYENKVLTSSSPTLLDAEAKVGATCDSGSYMMSNCLFHG